MHQSVFHVQCSSYSAPCTVLHVQCSTYSAPCTVLHVQCSRAREQNFEIYCLVQHHLNILCHRSMICTRPIPVHDKLQDITYYFEYLLYDRPCSGQWARVTASCSTRAPPLFKDGLNIVYLSWQPAAVLRD